MYDSPHQFEPLIPSEIPQGLLEKAATIVRCSMQLTGAAHSSTRATVRELVRSMNSYYSNRIEGQGTHPLNIEKALRKEFSDKPDVAQLQRIALAHIDAERELEELVDKGDSPMLSQFLVAAHRALYSRLSVADRTTKDGRVVAPGEIREEDVAVGRHVPPAKHSLGRFLARMDQVYSRPMSMDMQLIAIACAHHRVAWVHPFLDGNGRAVRLQTHCALWTLTNGLWSPSRGLARAQQEYYVKLSNADHPRQGQYDGRGNLTTNGLLQWIEFFLDVCDDQVRFMTKMLDLNGMKNRIEALIKFRGPEDIRYRDELILPLHYVFAAGPVSRGDFGRMTGMEERTARKSIALLLEAGLLVSDSKLGPVRLGLPLNSLQFLLPELYPEASTKPD